MISFARHPTAAQRNRQVRDEQTKLLARAKAILSRWDRLHSASVLIGRMERIAESGVIDAEVSACRTMVEAADRLCADIDRLSLVVENVESQQGAGNGLR